MIITLSGSAPPADQIHDQIHGLVSTGRLAADERLPSVRQLAKDLGVAPGTVGRAYRALEIEGVLVSRIGSGTRVGPTASTTTRPVLEAARVLVETSIQSGTSLDEAVRILRATWPTPPGTEV
ncbi:GntR family transcriptional regulator [Sanguibacter antarcticus]|uniref:DNA-binding transcriptional regulator YhcF (GntR family) n=1 Tax=Sanguibacter antarcticus TaxID=372484 RepID=A0A2A9E8K5_9MICO|nr:GntR family transcriptional regulator [Sanguibacter antarcticus]PFG34645.1 DNA-binding transcriptional regulator YhcF (GntR family) [Sanguibacter antarcticus]